MYTLFLFCFAKKPFRQADGRKVLRSSIREFLCSEAIFALGIPTTRAGSVVTSDSKVIRDINYDGNAIHERCSMVLRIAPTFLRFVKQSLLNNCFSKLSLGLNERYMLCHIRR
jgi:uncharacterized protein YdiU (UPF0061 family)